MFDYAANTTENLQGCVSVVFAAFRLWVRFLNLQHAAVLKTQSDWLARKRTSGCTECFSHWNTLAARVAGAFLKRTGTQPEETGP